MSALAGAGMLSRNLIKIVNTSDFRAEVAVVLTGYKVVVTY